LPLQKSGLTRVEWPSWPSTRMMLQMATHRRRGNSWHFVVRRKQFAAEAALSDLRLRGRGQSLKLRARYLWSASSAQPRPGTAGKLGFAILCLIAVVTSADLLSASLAGRQSIQGKITFIFWPRARTESPKVSLSDGSTMEEGLGRDLLSVKQGACYRLEYYQPVLGQRKMVAAMPAKCGPGSANTFLSPTGRKRGRTFQ
jgi:hypothetical protein